MSGSECSSSERQFHLNETDADIEDFFFIASPVDPLSMDYDNTEEVGEVEEDGYEEVSVEIINHNDIVETENETEEKSVVDRRKELAQEEENDGHDTEQNNKLVHLLQPPLHYYPLPQYYVPFLLPYPNIPVRNQCYPYCSYIM